MSSITKRGAQGLTTVNSFKRPECHAPSGFSVKDYSDSCTCETCRATRKSGGSVPGKSCPTFTSPRAQQRATILAFWESRGMARWVNGGAGGGGRWMVRDNSQGAAEFLPLATQDSGRSDSAEFSHVLASANSGAWCACNLVGEAGTSNASRGDLDMGEADLAPAWRATLAAWPSYYRANVARGKSLERLNATA